MSQFGEYLELWNKLKADGKICVKPTGCTIDQLRRSISKEKDEDRDISVKMKRIYKSAQLDKLGVPTGFYFFELKETANKTRATTISKILKDIK